jgi:hypothetical protein
MHGFYAHHQPKGVATLGFVVVYNHMVFVDITNQTTMYNLGFVATHDNGLFDKQLAIAMVRCKV